MGELNAPEAARRTALLGLQARERLERGGNLTRVHAALGLICDDLTFANLEAIAAGADDIDDPTDRQVAAALLGGPAGRRWAHGQLARRVEARTAAAALPTGERLRRLAAALSRIDADLRAQLTAAAAPPLLDALRRAGVRVENRLRSRRTTKAAAIALATNLRPDLDAGRYTPAVLAAVDLTQDEILEHAFDGFAATAGTVITNAQRRRRRALTRILRRPAADLEAWEPEEERHRDAAVGLLLAGLGAVVRERLTRPDVIYPTPGEVPAIPVVPPSLIGEATRASNGAPIIADPSVGREAVVGRLGEDEPNPIVAETVAQAAPNAVIFQTWAHGAPARPFEPHEELDGWRSIDGGLSWYPPDGNPEDAEEKPADAWPHDVDHWEPGDHPGCSCFLSPGWDVFDEVG